MRTQICQKAMGNTLQGFSGVFCSLDDILVVFKGLVIEYNQSFEEVFVRLDNECFTLKLSNYKITLY